MSDQLTANFAQKGFTKNLLELMKLREQFKLCCESWITQVFTQNSTTVTFTGLGTEASPLIATAIGGGGTSSANDGLSVVSGIVKLGQTVGQAGNPATLIENREVPLAGFSLAFSGTGQLMIGATVLDGTPTKLQVNGNVSEAGWYMPLTNLALTQGAGFVNGHLFWHNYEGAPALPGTATSVFIGSGGNGNVSSGNTGCQLNVGVGYQCMPVITSAVQNVGVGAQTLLGLTTGFNNMALGIGALEGCTTGFENVACGGGSLQNISTGSQNIGIGQSSGNNVNGNLNIMIGTGAGNGAGSASNKLYIGNDPGLVGVLPFIYGQMDTLTGRWNAKLGVNFQSALTTLPTASLHIAAGSAVAGTGPFKLTPGPFTTVPEDGLLEYNGTNLAFTIGATRHILI